MIDSRNIDDLHPTVARGCRELIRKMNEVGYSVGISSTYRDHEKQNQLYAQGRTTPGNIVTNAKGGQSIHNWRLAFDIFKNIKGQEWNDLKFFQTAGKIWVEMGGIWGGNWKSFPDNPHMECTFGKTLTQLQAGQIIPQDTQMEWEKKVILEELKMIYKKVSEMPEWARSGIQELIDLKVLSGRTPDNLDIDENMMRILLIVRNMFKKAGMLEKIAENK